VNVDLIVDCPFREHSDLDKLSNFVSSQGGVVKSILCECKDEELWAQRFNERSKHPAPNQLITDFEVLKTHYPTLHLDKYKDELVLDTQPNVDSLVLEVLAYLR
jgi:hypothetical protein